MSRIKFILIYTLISLVFVFDIAAEADVKSKTPFTFDGVSLAEFASVEDQPEIVGTSAYAFNLNTGTVVFEKNSLETVYPASTTKLLTAIVAFENIDDLDVLITASESAVRKTQGSNVRISAGESYTARELLNALLISGANDAALVLAEYVAESENEFCKLMNQKAVEIGAVNSHFDNVTGFHNDSTVTTAHDIALIAQYFYYIPELYEMSDTTRFNDSERLKRTLINRNLLLSRATTDKYYYSSAGGMSVGSTPEGGQCIVSTVTSRDGQIYLCVVMNSMEEDNINYAYKDIISIFKFCTDNFSYQTVASTGDVMCELPVKNAVDVDHFALFPDCDVQMLLPNNLDYANEISLEQRLYVDSAEAPINKKDVFGEVVVKYKDTVAVGRAKLVSDVSIDKSNVLYFFSRIEKIVTGKWFVAFAVIAVIIFGLYFGLSVYYKYFKKNKYTGNRPRYR